jgi:hypothetical protein
VKKRNKIWDRLAKSRAMRYLRMGGDDYLFELGAQSETRLSELAERRRFLLLTFLGALLATMLVWILALSFPRTSSHLFSIVANSNLPRYGNLLAVVAMAIPFGPPFVATFTLGRMIWPANETFESSSEVMAGFNYSQKANQRWIIVVIAGIIGGINCFLLLVALLIVTGN